MNDLVIKYFDWLCTKATGNYCYFEGYRLFETYSYYLLFSKLNNVKFKVTNVYDDNRYVDGIDLRYRFGYEFNITREEIDYISELIGACSVFEAMVALAIKCEENIMSDPKYGDRTKVWFEEMLYSMHLINSTDANYDEKYVSERINIMLNKEYSYNGDGGLFTVECPPDDMRKYDLHTQMCWYLNTL